MRGQTYTQNQPQTQPQNQLQNQNQNQENDNKKRGYEMIDMNDVLQTQSQSQTQIQLQNQQFDMEWGREHENILIDWADKAMCYRWLHAQANIKFSKLARWFTIPVIIISTVTGTANFAQDRVPLDFVHFFVMIVGTLNIIAGIISTIQQFLKINELNESHRVISIAWDKFYRNIKIELAKNPKERVPVGQMIKMSKEEFDRLMETSPVLQQDIIDKFSKTFKKSDTFKNIRKPEICDELVSTDIFRFIPKEIQEEYNKVNELQQQFEEQQERFKKNKQYVREFITRFKETQQRIPEKEEIQEALADDETMDVTSQEELEQIINIVLLDILTNEDGVEGVNGETIDV